MCVCVCVVCVCVCERECVLELINLCVTSEIFSQGQAFLAQGTDQVLKLNAVNSKSVPANHVTLY